MGSHVDGQRCQLTAVIFKLKNACILLDLRAFCIWFLSAGCLSCFIWRTVGLLMVLLKS